MRRRQPKFAKKKDAAQDDVVKKLREAGWKVYIIGYPVDLLCFKNGQMKLLEVKTPYGKKKPAAKVDKRQIEQNEFLQFTQTPVVTTPMEALLALGERVTLT